MSIGAAGNAFFQMILDDERTSGGQFLLMKSRQQGTNIVTTADWL